VEAVFALRRIPYDIFGGKVTHTFDCEYTDLEKK
jgi:hypothetical protein